MSEDKAKDVKPIKDGKENMRPGGRGGSLKTGGTHAKAGRPRKLPELKALLDEVLGEEKNNLVAMEAVLRAMVSKAVKGDVGAARVLFEYAYGKPSQQIDLTTGGDKLTDSHIIALPPNNRGNE